MISVFDMFKIGIGPSSSHTVGPMKAGKLFVDMLSAQQLLSQTTRVTVDIYGSLSLTGKGHHTDTAIIMGLAGESPDTVNIDSLPAFLADARARQRLLLALGEHEIAFDEQEDLLFHSTALLLHENGLTFTAWQEDKLLVSQTYYSIGGGFIVEESQFGQPVLNTVTVPYPFHSALEMLDACHQTGLSLSGLVMKNELALHSKQEINEYFSAIWAAMQACIDRGLNTEGVLPGPLRVPRRAAPLRRLLVANHRHNNDPMNVIDW